MFKYLLTSAFIAAAIASPVAAQDQDGASDDNVYDTLPMGALYFSETFSDWRLRCEKTEGGRESDPCQLHQYVRNEVGGIVAQITVFNLEEPQGVAVAAANVTVPLGTALGEGLRIKVDDKQAKGYPFAYCDDVGCHARIGFTAVELKWLQDGATAKMRTVPYSTGTTEPFLSDISLSGFTAGYQAVVDTNAQN